MTVSLSQSFPPEDLPPPLENVCEGSPKLLQWLETYTPILEKQLQSPATALVAQERLYQVLDQTETGQFLTVLVPVILSRGKGLCGNAFIPPVVELRPYKQISKDKAYVFHKGIHWAKAALDESADPVENLDSHQLQTLFKFVCNHPLLSWKYKGEGCAPRSDLTCHLIMASAGFGEDQVKKCYLYADGLGYAQDAAPHKWGFHTAAAFIDKAGKKYLFDPAVLPNEPASWDEWASHSFIDHTHSPSLWEKGHSGMEYNSKNGVAISLEVPYWQYARTKINAKNQATLAAEEVSESTQLDHHRILKKYQFKVLTNSPNIKEVSGKYHFLFDRQDIENNAPWAKIEHSFAKTILSGYLNRNEPFVIPHPSLINKLDPLYESGKSLSDFLSKLSTCIEADKGLAKEHKAELARAISSKLKEAKLYRDMTDKEREISKLHVAFRWFTKRLQTFEQAGLEEACASVRNLLKRLRAEYESYGVKPPVRAT